MTAAVQEFASIEHLDFDPSCQRVTCTAGNPTATHVTRAVCGCVTPVCSTCVEFLVSISGHRCRLVKCTRCQHVAVCRLYGDFFRIEPIR